MRLSTVDTKTSTPYFLKFEGTRLLRVLLAYWQGYCFILPAPAGFGRSLSSRLRFCGGKQLIPQMSGKRAFLIGSLHGSAPGTLYAPFMIMDALHGLC
jgi:hypothetical protein